MYYFNGGNLRHNWVKLLILATLLLVPSVALYPLIEGVSASDVIRVPQHYPTIGEAIYAAESGDTILVSPGTYPEWNLLVNKTLSLVGEDAETTIIDGSGAGTSILTIVADNVTLSGFTVKNCSKIGICLKNSIGATISGNIISDCRCGLALVSSNYNTIIDNDVLNNTYIGIWFISSSYNIFEDNIIEFNYMYGIVFAGTPGCNLNIVTGNNIKGTRGLYHTGAGFDLDMYSRDNIAYHNNFIHNRPYNAWDSGDNGWDIGCEGNYWSDYIGTDADGDGIGDTPYDWCRDNYPLINPYWNPADVNHDLKVDIYDVVLVCGAYGSKPEDDNWNPHCDIAKPYNTINIYDVVTACANYGKQFEG